MIELIEESVRPGTEIGNLTATIHELAGAFVVSDQDWAHRCIEDVLDALTIVQNDTGRTAPIEISGLGRPPQDRLAEALESRDRMVQANLRLVVNIAKQIIEFGRAKIPFIGVEMGENPTETVGVYILEALEGYPGEKAGIKAGDIIMEFDRVEVKTRFELFAQILKRNVGDIIEIKIFRDNRTQIITLKLAEAPITENKE